jgi:two-component system sensor kinase FixL
MPQRRSLTGFQIQQVLLNLMRNAAEAMAGWGRCELSVTMACVGDMVEISVADTGPGLPETVRERLFQPFVTTKPAGMGVGLSVCRTIVEVHGGQIRAEEVPGGGTVFRFTAPRAGHDLGQCRVEELSS